MQIHEYIPFARRWIPIALILAIVCAGGAYALSKYVLKPIYTSTVTMQVVPPVSSALSLTVTTEVASAAETDAALAEQGPVVRAGFRHAAAIEDSSLRHLESQAGGAQTQLGYLQSRLKSLKSRFAHVPVSQKAGLAKQISNQGYRVGKSTSYLARLNSQIKRIENRIIGKQSPTAACQTNGITALFSCSVTANSPIFAADGANGLASAFLAEQQKTSASRYVTVLGNLNKNAAAINKKISLWNARLARAITKGKPTGGIQGQITNYTTQLGTNSQSISAILGNEASQSTLVTVVTPAAKPTGPSSPHPTLNALVAFFLVFLLAVGFGLGAYKLNDAVRGDEELKELTGLPVLGSIPYVEELHGHGRTPDALVAARAPRSQIAEALRMIRTSITLTNFDKPARVLLVTSSVQDEGKSTVAANLAVAFAESGKRTILVDLDMRRPSVAKIFAASGPGLSNLLIADDSDDQDLTIQTPITNLRVLPTGPLPPMPAELIGSHKMQSVMEKLLATADLIIVDTPPLLAVADSTIAATLCDAAIVVVRPDIIKRRMILRSAELLQSAGIRVAGMVVNTVAPTGQSGYYSGYRYSQSTYGYAPTSSPSDKPGPPDSISGSEKPSKSRVTRGRPSVDAGLPEPER